MGNASGVGDTYGFEVTPCEFNGSRYDVKYIGCNVCKKSLKYVQFFACHTCTKDKINCVKSMELCADCVRKHSLDHQVLMYIKNHCLGRVTSVTGRGRLKIRLSQQWCAVYSEGKAEFVNMTTGEICSEIPDLTMPVDNPHVQAGLEREISDEKIIPCGPVKSWATARQVVGSIRNVQTQGTENEPHSPLTELVAVLKKFKGIGETPPARTVQPNIGVHGTRTPTEKKIHNPFQLQFSPSTTAVPTSTATPAHSTSPLNTGRSAASAALSFDPVFLHMDGSMNQFDQISPSAVSMPSMPVAPMPVAPMLVAPRSVSVDTASTSASYLPPHRKPCIVKLGEELGPIPQQNAAQRYGLLRGGAATPSSYSIPPHSARGRPLPRHVINGNHPGQLQYVVDASGKWRLTNVAHQHQVRAVPRRCILGKDGRYYAVDNQFGSYGKVPPRPTRFYVNRAGRLQPISQPWAPAFRGPQYAPYLNDPRKCLHQPAFVRNPAVQPALLQRSGSAPNNRFRGQVQNAAVRQRSVPSPVPVPVMPIRVA